VKNPKARASIIWVVGEYVDKVSTYAPDILRQLAKEFCESDETVKNQILNLGTKLFIKNPDQTALIVQYILNLAKYDVNYDIRDKSRMMRHILCNPQNNFPVLSSHARDLYITCKPTPNIPVLTTPRFVVGSLAQVINQTTPGYNAIPEWSETIQNSDLRQPEIPIEQSPQSPRPYGQRPTENVDFDTWIDEQYDNYEGQEEDEYYEEDDEEGWYGDGFEDGEDYDGEGYEGEAPEEEAPEGEADEGEVPEGEAPEGDTAEMEEGDGEEYEYEAEYGEEDFGYGTQ